MPTWTCVLELDPKRRATTGSTEALAEAIRRGADLRVGTEFVHNEHIDVTSDAAELVREVAEFGVTYLLQGEWVAGIMSLRQPIELPVGFGPRPSMSFFLYNQDGQQAIARPFLDGIAAHGPPGRSPGKPPDDMPKYHVLDSWDAATNAPCENFVYDFGVFRYHVSDTWREVLAHGADGRVHSGALDELTQAFAQGAEIKVGVSGVCADLAQDDSPPLEHELFVQGGSGYHYTDRRLLMAGSHPVVRVRPAVPLRYETGAWDFGWLFVRTDGHVVYRRCDPYTLEFSDHPLRCGVRWFVR